MALKIRETSSGAQDLQVVDVDGDLQGEPPEYENEPTEWRNFLTKGKRAELEAALLDLCRFFVAQIAAEQGKSVAALQLADIEHQVIVQGRNSQADDGRGSSARAQMFIAAKKLVAEDGWPVEVWYEYAQSAFLKWTKPRDWYQRKFELVKAGEARAKIIMPTFASRKTRRLSEMAAWLDLLEHQGMRMICASEPGHHLDTPLEEVHGWWVRQADISQAESVAKSKMINNKQLEMLNDGIVTHGYGQCFGYEPVVDPNRISRRGNPTEIGARLVRTKPSNGGRSEAEWLALAFQKRLAGLDWSAIERECYGEGCRSRSGNLIRGGSWKKMLIAPRTIGCERKDGQLFRVQIERLATDDDYESLMAMEGLDPETGELIVGRKRKYRRRYYPLSGLLRCCCGAPMVGKKEARYGGGEAEVIYKCSRPDYRIAKADGVPWETGVARDGKQHTTISGELAHAFFRKLVAAAIGDFDAELWRVLDEIAGQAEPSSELEMIEGEIARLDDQSAWLDLQIERQSQPGYRGKKISREEAKQQFDANARHRARLVSEKVKLEQGDARKPTFPRDADVRAEILNCTDGELRTYVTRVFERIGVRRGVLGEDRCPERRIEWDLADGHRISAEFVERVLEEADQAQHLRFIAGAKAQRDPQLEQDAYELARMGLNGAEITRQLNELGYRTRTGKELQASYVRLIVRRVMLERDDILWSPPPLQRELSDELLDSVERMREGGATWNEVSVAFGKPDGTLRRALKRRLEREHDAALVIPRSTKLNRNVQVLCWQMSRLEERSYGEVAREMMRLKRRTPLGRATWYRATVQHIVEQFERREPDWCAARLARHEALHAAAGAVAA